MSRKEEKFSAGELRDFITIQQPVRTADNYGGSTVSWTTFAQCWARVDSWRGSQDKFADEQRMTMKFRVVIRQLSGVTSDMRLSWASAIGTKILQVKTIRNLDNQGRFFELFCVQGDAS